MVVPLNALEQGSTVSNKANSHKSLALGTISHKIYTKLRNVRESQKCTEDLEINRSPRNVKKSQKCTEAL